MADKKGFVMYKEWRPLIEKMSAEQKAELLDAIYAYQYNEDPALCDNAVEIVFNLLRVRFDEDQEKYEETSRARSEARKGKQEKTIDNNCEQLSTNDNNCEQKPLDRDRDRDRDINNTLSFTDVNDCQTDESVRRVVDEWNKLEPLGIKPVTKIHKDSKRYKLAKTRIKQNGEIEVIRAINRIRGSDFLLGKKTDFMINFDWFVKPENFQKVADGNYDNHTGGNGFDPAQYLLDKIAGGGFDD